MLGKKVMSESHCGKKPPAPRRRVHPDTQRKVTDDFKAWFHENTSQSGRELLGRLQAAHPDDYPD